MSFKILLTGGPDLSRHDNSPTEPQFAGAANRHRPPGHSGCHATVKK